MPFTVKGRGIFMTEKNYATRENKVVKIGRIKTHGTPSLLKGWLRFDEEVLGGDSYAWITDFPYSIQNTSNNYNIYKEVLIYVFSKV